MSRRSILEKELDIVQQRIDNASADIPKEILNSWRKEYDSISIELNNLYDDDEIQIPD